MHERHARGPGARLCAARARRRRVDFAQWCEGLAHGRSYVSDGYAHAVEFARRWQAFRRRPAARRGRPVNVKANVAFSPETPLEIAYGARDSRRRPGYVGDTVNYHDTQAADRLARAAASRIVVNGQPVAQREVPADDQRARLSNSSAASRAAVGSRCGNSRSCTRIRSTSWWRDNRSALHARARSGRSPASSNSGACARAGLRRRNAPRPKRPTTRRGRSTAGSPWSRQQRGERSTKTQDKVC